MTYNVQMMAESLVGTQTYVSGVSYDAAGRVRLRSLGDSLQTEYTYNAWSQQGGRLSWLKSGPTGSPEALQKLEYGYDAGGNVTSIRDYLAATPYEELVYGYDALNRLTGVSGGLSESYTYDANTDNLNSKAGQAIGYTDASHKHAATSMGSNIYSYDSNGNMIQRVVGGHTYILIYDAENRLVEVQKDSLTIATFVYDADGRRIKGVVDGTTSYYYFTHYEVVNGSVRKYYALGGQAVAMRNAGALTYLFLDHLGSTTVTADTNGAKVAELRYKPWGETRYTDGITPTARHYTGQYEESAFDLYFYNARWYDPALGRFVQADIIVPQPDDPLGWDRYAYTINNPLRYVDPSGNTNVAVCPLYRDDVCVSAPEYQNAESRLMKLVEPPIGNSKISTHYGALNTLIPEYETEKDIRKLIEKYGLHAGVDFDGDENDDILAVYDGIVVFISGNDAQGMGIKILIEHEVNGYLFYSLYGHLNIDSVKVLVGQKVKTGELIAGMGNTPWPKSAFHLHFEIRKTGNINQSTNGQFSGFPYTPQSFWANNSDELATGWVDLTKSVYFGDYDIQFPVSWINH